jgi:hypothetical protein
MNPAAGNALERAPAKAKSRLGWTPKYTAAETLSAAGEAI